MVATRFPQNLQRAFPGEMWTRCMTNSMRGSLPNVKRERDADRSCAVARCLVIRRRAGVELFESGTSV